MCTVNRRTALFAFDTDSHGTCASTDLNAKSIQAKVDPFSGENLLNRRGDVGVFVLDKPWSHLDDCHLRTEPAKHLSEFQPNVATADDHEMRRHRVQVHHRAVRQEGNPVEPWNRRDSGEPTAVDEGAIGWQRLVCD